MVRLLRLTTRCASTMATGTSLRGLLHGRQHTPTPLLLPPRTPKCLTCPWTALALIGHCPRLRTHTYSEVLCAPPSTKHRHSRRRTNRIFQSIPPPPTSHKSLFSSKRPRRGNLRWQLLVHRLTLLLPSIIHQPSPTIILPQLDPVTNWLPTSYSTQTHHHTNLPNITDGTPSTHDPQSHLPEDISFDWNDNTDATNDYSDNNATDPLPATHLDDITDPHTPKASEKYPNKPTNNASTFLTTAFSHEPQYLMDISKIYTQNAHGLWCRPRDSDGNIIPNSERDNTKLEHLIHGMRTNDIDAWLLQETWLEDDVIDMIIGGYHIFRHNLPIGNNGRDHLFRGVAIILSPRYYLA